MSGYFFGDRADASVLRVEYDLAMDFLAGL